MVVALSGAALLNGVSSGSSSSSIGVIGTTEVRTSL